MPQERREEGPAEFPQTPTFPASVLLWSGESRARGSLPNGGFEASL